MTKDKRDKIRANAKKVLSAGKMNVMLLPCAEVLSLLTALDESEKKYDKLDSFNVEMHLRHLNDYTSVQAENTRLKELLGEVLPHVECVNPIQSQLITEIGEYLEALKGDKPPLPERKE